METVMSEMKKRSNAVAAYAVIDGKHTWDFGAEIGQVTFDPDKVSDVNRARFMMFGMKQRIADAAALSRNPETGESASPAEKCAEMLRMAEHYMTGTDQWELRAAGPKEDGASWVSRALVELGKAADVAEANAKVVKLAEAKFGGEVGKARAALAKAEDVKKAIIRLKEAAVKPDASADDLLAALDAEYEPGKPGYRPMLKEG